MLKSLMSFPDGSLDKQSPCSAGDTGDSCSVPELGRSPGEGDSNLPVTFLVLLPGKSHGQRRLVVYIPKGHKESDTTDD